LNESQIAIGVLDATGHGLAAGLLAAHLRRSLNDFILTADVGCSPQPDEVLVRLNKHLLELELEECQFVTAVYLVYNEHTRVVQWARAGAPYPVLIRPGRQPSELISSGPLLGVLSDATFEVVNLQLRPGETFVVYSDGLDALVSDRRRGHGSRALSPVELFYEDRAGGFAEFWSEFSAFVGTSSRSPEMGDDVTVVALHVEQPESPGSNAERRRPRAMVSCAVD
jgi:hypothetical protein